MTDAREAPVREPQVPLPRPPVRDVEPAVLLPAAGNGAIARMFQSSATTTGGLAGLSRVAGNAEVSRFAEQPPAPGGAVMAPPAPAAGGEAVREAQVKLSRLQSSAQPLTEDGRYGPLTEAAVRTFQTGQGLPPTGVLDAVTRTRLDAAFAALPPPVRPPLVVGATGADVGFAQQKLNSRGATPRLVVNGVYDAAMSPAVIVFEIAVLRRIPTGTVDAAMWTELDRTGGGFVAPEGAGATPIEQSTPSGTADPRGLQLAGTSLHPLVGPGGLTRGPAVRELQQKLTAAHTVPPLRDDGVFGPITATALHRFQTGRVPPLAAGPADKATWDALDAVAPGSTVGAVERQWTEIMGGHEYGMTGASAARYSWEVQKSRVLVTVKVNFVGLPAPGAWFGYVAPVWNRYAGVEAGSGRTMPIDFQLVPGTGGDAKTVQVHPGTDRANAGHWYVADPDAASTVPHEFGHLIGLQDEYQLHPGDYRRVTGHEPQVGDATGPGGLLPATVAANLRAAMLARSSANALAASNTAGVRPGAFAQQVVQEYAKLGPATVPAVAAVPGPPPVPAQLAVTLGADLIADLDAALPGDPDRYETIQTFTHTSGTIMGDPGRGPDPHEHGAQPRHIAEFVAILGRALGGTWEAKLR
ncbi:peptidoglycan-binding domain-containing protein [Micromonosporaceae bacterium Da 78-11]